MAFDLLIGTNLVAKVNLMRRPPEMAVQARRGINIMKTATSSKRDHGHENIRVTFKAKADASEEQLRELVDLAQKRSPVFDIASHPVTVSVEIRTY